MVTRYHKKRVIVWLLTLCFLLTQIMAVPVLAAPTDNTASASGTSRLAGDDRYQTAVAVSQKGWEEAEYAVLARGDQFPDALSAGPLAYEYNAPILLTEPQRLNTDTLNELKRLGVKQVFIVGGASAVSEAVANSLESAGIEVERLSGNGRYDTALEIAKKLGSKTEVVLATGVDFPDALSISAIAAKLGMPILLTEKDRLPEGVKAYFQNNNVTKTYIIGGTGAISAAVENSVPNPVRLAGDNRYGTNTAVLEHFAAELDYSTTYVAKGTKFPDALAGAVLAAKNSAPLVLVGQGLPEVTEPYLKSKLELDTKVVGLGGRAVVAGEILTAIVDSKADIAADEHYAQAGTYGPESGSNTIRGDVIISSRDVTLQNTVIEGDLLLASRIGDGDVELNNVTVNGKTIVNGGGPNSIILINFNGQTVVVDVPEGSNVRLVAQGDTTVQNLAMESNGQLEESNLTGAGFTTVVIPAGAQVTLKGDFEEVAVQGAGAQVNVEQGSIATMTVAKTAANAAVNLASEAKVTNLVAEAPANVSGQGQITNAEIKTDGVAIEQKPENVTIAEGVKEANVGGEAVSDTNPPTPSTPPAAGGGGGGGGPTPISIEVVRAVNDVTQDAGSTGGENLEYSFIAEGKVLTIDAQNSTLPYYEVAGTTPPRGANWVGVAIPIPDGVDTEKVTATINGTACTDLFFAEGKYMEYIDVKADDLTNGAAIYTWVIKWGGDYADETITINLVNVGSLEVPVSAISITGDAVVGKTLTATPTPTNATVTYKWQIADAENGEYVAIEGATDKTYIPNVEDIGKYIRVVVEGYDSYQGTKTSAAVGPVEAPEYSIYKLSYTDLAESYVVVDSLMETDGYGKAIDNTEVEQATSGLIPVKLTLETEIEGEKGYDSVRIAPVGAGDDIQFWAKDVDGGGNWYNINISGWGDLSGFKLEAQYTATTDIYILSNKAGTYNLTVQLVDVDNNNEVIAEVRGTVQIRDKETSEYGFEIEDADQDFVAGVLLESSDGIIAEDGVETTGLTPVNVTLRATDIKELGYEKVKVLPPNVAQTKGSGGQLQFWAYSADDGLWFDAAVHGWGSGFPITADYDVTTPIYVFADTAGTYEVTFKLVEWSESGQVGEPITTITATITVISQEMANAINSAKEAIKPSWAVDSVEPVDDEALPSGVENVDYKVTIKTSYENKGEAQASGRTVTTLFTIPDGVTVWYPVWEDGKLTYISASSGEVALGMVGHPLSEENIDADGIVYVALGETTETKFTVTIKLIDADEDWQGVVYSEQELEIKVPEVSEYGFVINDNDDNIEIIAGGLLDGYVYESEDGKKLGNLEVSDLTAVKVTLEATEVKDLGYKKVRILPLKVEGPANSNLQAWMYASENDKKWWDTAVTGWGTAGTGFKLDADEYTEMDVYVFVDTPGNYTVTFKAVDTSDPENEIVIAEGTTTIFAPFHFDAVSGTISKYVGAEENIEIPAIINGVPVKAIGAGTFDGKASIKTVTFAEGSQLEVIGDNAFKHCQHLESIALPSTVKSIGNGAFMSCDLTEIDISKVESIGEWAFSGCEFEEITIPDGCNVGLYAFGYCEQLNKIKVGSEVVLNENNALVLYFVDSQVTDRGFGDAYDGAGTYVLQDGTWTKQQP